MELRGPVLRMEWEALALTERKESLQMTMHKHWAVLLLCAWGAVSIGLSGCKGTSSTYTERSYSENSDATASDSGAVNISKMGGEIEVENAPHGATLNTMGGDIHLGSVASFAKLKTMGGNIRIDQASGKVDAVTMGGNITIDHADGAVKASTMGGDITVHLAAGGAGSSTGPHDVELSSNGGTIDLVVEKNFPMDVEVTLAYTKNAKRTYHIDDNLGLTQTSGGDWDDSQGTPRKYIRAKGRVGSGTNRVSIKTIDGDVVIRQE